MPDFIATAPLSSHGLLALAIIALFIGPALQRLSVRHKLVMGFVDGFTLIVVLELVIFHLLPHAVEDSGLFAVIIAIVGFLLPGLMENHLQRTLARKAHFIALAIALIGIILHSFADGLALIPEASTASQLLPIAIICHQLPVGLTIWWLVRPQYGARAGILILGLMAVTTLIGYITGKSFVSGLDHHYMALFESLVAGTLLHVMLHRHDQELQAGEIKSWKQTSGWGALIGIGFVALINRFVDTAVFVGTSNEHIRVFVKLALESAPALVVAYLLSGLLNVFMTNSSVRWLISGNHFSQALKGMAFGLPLPICSCGVVPLYRSLIQKKVPISASIAFFVATPELGVDAFLLSLPLLGLNMTIIRLVTAAIIGFLAGYIIGKINPDTPIKINLTDDTKTETLPFRQKLLTGFKSGFVDVVDHTAPWILFGLWIAALAEPLLSHSNILNDLPDTLEVVLFALLGMPLYVCASGITPFVAILIANGVSPGAALAFLITGPATNVTTFGILTTLHGRKLALQFAILMAVSSIGIGILVNALFGSSIASTAANPLTHEHHDYQIFFLAVLTVIFLMALLRSGPRFLLRQIVAFESFNKQTDQHLAHSHAHGHDHHHSEPNKKSCCDHD